jgi:hypothetical protein
MTRSDTPFIGSDAIGTDQPTAAATSATTGPVPAVSPTRLRRNGANATDRNSSNNTAAAALQDVAAAAAAAAANCEDPNIFNAVLKAAATTAKALADCRVRARQGHRRGGRPPPTRKERPGTWRRSTLQRSAGSPAPRVADTHTATQSRRTQQGQHNPPTANSLLREGQNRPWPGG